MEQLYILLIGCCCDGVLLRIYSTYTPNLFYVFGKLLMLVKFIFVKQWYRYVLFVLDWDWKLTVISFVYISAEPHILFSKIYISLWKILLVFPLSYGNSFLIFVKIVLVLIENYLKDYIYITSYILLKFQGLKYPHFLLFFRKLYNICEFGYLILWIRSKFHAHPFWQKKYWVFISKKGHFISFIFRKKYKRKLD